MTWSRTASRARVKITLATIVALLFLWSASSAAAPSTLAHEPQVADAIRVLDVWIAASVAEREQPGISIGIVHDQEMIWAKGYGFADVEKRTPATSSTLYRIASITKLFTATALLQLRDAGKLALDDPVAKYLSWFQIKNAHPQGPVITIRHLLTHTSGLPRQVLGDSYNDLKFPTREEMMRRLPEQATVFPAETKRKYSNLALVLAGEIVTAVSGESYPQYVEKRILAPLGMNETRVIPTRDMPGLARGYTRRLPGGSREATGFVDRRSGTSAGNIASSVEDLSKFASLQFRDGPAGGTQVLKGFTLREMHRVQWLAPDWRSGQGLGFALRRVGEKTRVGHSGGLPGYSTLIEIAPADKLAVVVLTNSDDGEPRRYVDQAFAILRPAVARATAPPETPQAPDPAWNRYLGTYAWKGAEIQILVVNGQLTMVSPDSENPWDSRVTLKPAGDHSFRMQGGYADGELLQFELDSSGKPVRVTAPGSYWLRK